jgi:hypothetical protein
VASAQYLADFNKSYQTAQNAKTKLEDLYEKIVHLQSKPAVARVADQHAHQVDNNKLHAELDHSALLRSTDPSATLGKPNLLAASSTGLYAQTLKQGSSLAELQSKEQMYP